jgi:glycosyltransferase involved in cell wall biosynthesis
MYSGNMGLTHDLESVVEAARLFVNSKVVFVFIGEGGKKKKLEAIRTQYNLENVLFLPYQDATMFPFAMASADVGVVTLGTGAEGISVPSKTYVNMAAGLAILAISPANSELDRIIEHLKIGFCVLPGQPEVIAAHIKTLMSDPEKLAELKVRARSASLNFTSANAKQYVQAIYQSTN